MPSSVEDRIAELDEKVDRYLGEIEKLRKKKKELQESQRRTNDKRKKRSAHPGVQERGPLRGKRNKNENLGAISGSNPAPCAEPGLARTSAATLEPEAPVADPVGNSPPTPEEVASSSPEIKTEPQVIAYLYERTVVPKLDRAASSASSDVPSASASFDSDADDDESGDEEEGKEVALTTPTWSDVVKNSDARIFRIRIFRRHAMTSTDRAGSMPAEWCTKNGYVLCSTRMVPDEISTPNQIADFLESPELIELQKQQEGFATIYVTTYLHFLTMVAGDIVAMQIPGPEGGTYFFGVVQDQSVSFLSRQQLERDGFPALQLFERKEFRSGRLMARKVHWIRKAKMKSLRKFDKGKGASNHCKWLMECVPLWLSNVTKMGGMQHLRSSKFLAMSEAMSSEER